MNKELILKAVQAVMDFNEYFHSEEMPISRWKNAGFEFSYHSVTMSIHNGADWDLYINAQPDSNEQINKFIQKLDELKAV